MHLVPQGSVVKTNHGVFVTHMATAVIKPNKAEEGFKLCRFSHHTCRALAIPQTLSARVEPSSGSWGSIGEVRLEMELHKGPFLNLARRNEVPGSVD